jgi:SnoaL-like domain
MATATREIVADYIQAVGEGRLDRVEELLHPDVDFGGTAAELHGANAYVSALRRLARVVVRNDIKQIIVEGNQAFVLYDFVTDTEVGAVLSGELLTIEDGRIRSVALLFDHRRWPEVLQELGRRSAHPVLAPSS